MRAGSEEKGKAVKLVQPQATFQQDGFPVYVDSLKTKDPGQQYALAVAKRRYAATFPTAR